MVLYRYAESLSAGIHQRRMKKKKAKERSEGKVKERDQIVAYFISNQVIEEKWCSVNNQGPSSVRATTSDTPRELYLGLLYSTEQHKVHLGV